MKRGIKLLVVVTSAVLFLAFGHSLAHFYIFGTGIHGFLEGGISGFSVGKFSVGEEKTESFNISASISQFMVLFEWSLVLVFFIFVYVRNRIDFRKETTELNLQFKEKNHSNRTDLDILYELLKERKRISFAAITETFAVDGDVVKVWAEILETGNLASVEYPRIGGTELVLYEQKQKSKLE